MRHEPILAAGKITRRLCLALAVPLLSAQQSSLLTMDEFAGEWKVSAASPWPQPKRCTAHHRAQCQVYLRVKGIVPPDYLF